MRHKLFILLFILFPLILSGQGFPIEKLGIEHGLSNNYIVSIAQDKKGFIWMASESGLNRFDGNKFKVYTKNITPGNSSVNSNELNCVYADKTDNIIWVATQREGLNAFDCSTETFTYYQHNPDTVDGIITNDITDIINASDGNLWVSTYYRGVEYFDKKKKKFIHYNKETIPDMVDEKIWTIREDNKGSLYIGHVKNGLSILSLKDKTIKNFTFNPKDPHSLPGYVVRAICIDRNGNIWIGTDNGLALFNPMKESFTVFKHIAGKDDSLLANYICAITQLDDGRILIGSENGGISILDLQQGMFLSPQNISFTNIAASDSKEGLSDKTVRALYQDSFDNIWIGTYGGGINFISSIPQAFNTWSYSSIPEIKNRLNNNIAWGICSDGNNNLWIGTDGSGINYFEGGIRKRVFDKEKGDLSGNAVLAAIRDSENNLWFGLFRKGLNIYNPKRKKFLHQPIDKLAENDIRCLYEDDQKTMWIGSDYGLYAYNMQTRELKNFNAENSPLTENFVRAISKDNAGNIWIGTFGQGLYIMNKDMEHIETFNTRNKFYSNTINHLFKDKKGQMWVATGEGLAVFTDHNDLSKHKIFREDNGPTDSYIRAITEDKQGDIWISTNNGISRFLTEQSKFYNYDYTSGVPIGNFMSGSVTKTSDGSIYFGSQNGICYFNPDNIPTNMNLSPTVITDISIYDAQISANGENNSIQLTAEIELSYKQNMFIISFNTLNYAQNRMTEYAYQFGGLEDIWHNTQGERAITFRNMPPGDYTFKLKSRIKNQEWSDNITSIKITIHPPLWLTWWAKLIYVVFIAAIIYCIIRFYKRKLNLENILLLEKRNHHQEQELNNERLRFYTNITHELRTPLTLILGPLDDLKNDNSLSEKHTSKISLIHKSATRLLNLINQILEFRKTETQNKKLCVGKGDIVSLVREIGMKYKELNINKKVSVNINIDTSIRTIFYDIDIVTTILDNLISNALKHTKKGSVCINLKDSICDNISYIEFEIRDTGIGILAEELDKIFDRYYQVRDKDQVSGSGIGLALVKSLVKIHRGTITVDSKEGKGTSFCFKLDANNVYADAIHVNNEEVIVAELQQQIPSEHREENASKNIILVVEDNNEIREYIKSSLTDNYRVITAENGAKGLELAYTYTPDIIISDIMMPEMDGIELCRRLKKDIRTSHIPIVLLTAKDTLQDKTAGYNAGADSYLVKPFSSNLLNSRIINILESRKKMAELINNSPPDKSTAMLESLNQLDNEFIEKVTNIIELNLDSDKIDVAFIAEKMNMSHSTLYRKIKALTNISANEFIRKIRIYNGEKLLLTGKYTVSEVSYMIGINSPTYFRQCFKEKYGLSPSEYIKYIMNQKKTE